MALDSGGDCLTAPGSTRYAPGAASVSAHAGDDPYRVLDLFSGIGGFSLGLERTGGFQTVAFCEIDPFCRRVLAKHWPEVPCYDDIRTLTANRLAADGIAADVLCGGFPCQDISDAGLRAGINGERSGLWSEYARLIGEIRPKFVIVENVAALLGRGLDHVLGTMAEVRYDAEWHCIQAAVAGAPHSRDRIWVLAYPSGERRAEAGEDSQRSEEWTSGRASILAHATRGETWSTQPSHGGSKAGGRWQIPTSSVRGRARLPRATDWDTEPAICRVADGISANVDRDCALGNAVVPQIPELIGRAILSHRVAA